jgi:hypothetical protein
VNFFDHSKRLTFEQTLPKSAISKLLVQASHVRERLMARAAICSVLLFDNELHWVNCIQG